MPHVVKRRDVMAAVVRGDAEYPVVEAAPVSPPPVVQQDPMTKLAAAIQSSVDQMRAETRELLKSQPQVDVQALLDAQEARWMAKFQMLQAQMQAPKRPKIVTFQYDGDKVLGFEVTDKE